MIISLFATDRFSFSTRSTFSSFLMTAQADGRPPSKLHKRIRIWSTFFQSILRVLSEEFELAERRIRDLSPFSVMLRHFP